MQVLGDVLLSSKVFKQVIFRDVATMLYNRQIEAFAINIIALIQITISI